MGHLHGSDGEGRALRRILGQLEEALVREHVLRPLHVHIHRVAAHKPETPKSRIITHQHRRVAAVSRRGREEGRARYRAGRRFKWLQRSSSKPRVCSSAA